MKLVIFDLDQTLVDVLGVHDAAVQELFRREFGIKASLMEIDFAGRSIQQNLLALAYKKSVPDATIARTGIITDIYDNIFIEKLPDNAVYAVLPGVFPLLKTLEKKGHLTGLYTGDSDKIANAVLHATGLDHFLKLRVGSDEANTRADQLKLVVSKAENIVNRTFRKASVVVIGDSVRDIDSGREIGAVTIAVTTGPHTEKELGQHRPDYLFPSLNDYQLVIEAVETTT